MSMKEGFEQQDPELQGRQGVVHAAVAAFETEAWRQYGSAVALQEEQPVPAGVTMASVEASTLGEAAAKQSMAAISTQAMVEMSGAQDVRVA